MAAFRRQQLGAEGGVAPPAKHHASLDAWTWQLASNDAGGGGAVWMLPRRPFSPQLRKALEGLAHTFENKQPDMYT